MKMYLSTEPLLHTELLSGHDCMFRTNNTYFKQAKAAHRERRYCWTRIYPFSINSLKASFDKAKKPNW